MSRKVSLVLSFSILLLATAAAGQQDANKAKPVAITPANSGQSTDRRSELCNWPARRARRQCMEGTGPHASRSGPARWKDLRCHC